MKNTSHAACLVLVASSLAVGCTQMTDDIVSPPEAYVLTFEDEFDGAEGTSPDSSIWQFDLGTGPNADGWGNQELQFYTGSTDNASLDGNGNLRITAREEELGGQMYTSARIRTQGNFEQRYGRIEARMRIPAGRGLWPAFWMLGNDFPETAWPRVGEIDVMEARGQATDEVAGSIHGPGYSGGEAITESFTLPDDVPTFDQEFHTFAVEWDPGRIAWFVDDQLYHVATTGQVRNQVPLPGATQPDWVFDHPFFLILNLAVGGTYVGDPDDTTPFPGTLLVDYVRVYDRNTQ